MPNRAHLITGGYPIGSTAGHDMDYARLELLRRLYANGFQTTSPMTSPTSAPGWTRRLLVTRAGPYPKASRADHRRWIAGGGRWCAARNQRGTRKRVEAAAAEDGPARPSRPCSARSSSPSAGASLPRSPSRRPPTRFSMGCRHRFEVTDELYWSNPWVTAKCFLSTELAEDPSPEGFGFALRRDTSSARRQDPGACLGEESATAPWPTRWDTAFGGTNSQPFVDRSVDDDGKTPMRFRGAWETPSSGDLDNAMGWGRRPSVAPRTVPSRPGLHGGPAAYGRLCVEVDAERRGRRDQS